MEREQAVNKIKEKLLKDSNGRRDISAVYTDVELMDYIVAELAANFQGKVDYVAAPESLGFILGTYLSAALHVGFIPMRNGNNLSVSPEDAYRSVYIDHRDCARSLQVRKCNLPKGSRVLLVDDWVQTGSTLHACRDIIEEAGAVFAGIASVGCYMNNRTKALLEKGILSCIAECE